MLERLPRWAVVAGLALVPAAALAAVSASPEVSGLCGSLCSMLFGCGG